MQPKARGTPFGPNSCCIGTGERTTDVWARPGAHKSNRQVTSTKETQVISLRWSGAGGAGIRKWVMEFLIDGIALEQARALGGLKHRRPQDNYSLTDLNGVDVLFCARGLAGKGSDFIFGKWALELDPLHPVGMGLDHEVLGL